MARILIVEDEEEMARGLKDNFEFDGDQVLVAADGEQGLASARSERPDLIILDVMLPKMSGFDVCKKIRAEGIKIPVIMLTARDQEIDKVLGLELGADDYVTKPFSSRELLARVKALLRRARQPGPDMGVCAFGNVEIDFKKYEAKKNGAPIYLTALEFSLLQCLIKHRDEVVHRDAVLNQVWGEHVHVDPRTVDKHVSSLRQKLEDDPEQPRHIVGVRGVGYRFGG